MSQFGNSWNILNFSLLLYLLWWPVIFDVTIAIVLRCHKPCPYKTVNLTGKWCVRSEPSTERPFPVSLLLLGPLYSLRHNNVEIRPVNNPTTSSKCSSERKKLHVSPFKSKARNDQTQEGTSKAKKGWKLGLSHQSAKPIPFHSWRERKVLLQWTHQR